VGKCPFVRIQREVRKIVRFSSSQQNAIKQTLTSVLSTTRPEEVMLVDTCFEEESSLGTRGSSLEFGPGAEIPIAMSAVFHVLTKLASTAANRVAEEWGHELAHWLLGKGTDRHSLQAEPLNKIRGAVVARLRGEGFAANEAERIGDCLVATLIAKPALILQVAGKE
jgi:hypothetical protein